MPSEIEILLKEYDTLRTEVIERVKIAFSHLAFFGAVIAFAFQASEKAFISPVAVAGFAAAGAAILLYISIIIWCWVGRISSHLQGLDKKISDLTGKPILTWKSQVKNMSL